jgi:signal transduction histidine kinase/ABC-type branched-subunit amino acid transport system ATPase component
MVVRKGSVHALVGEADSGRETVRRVLCGELRAYSGEALVAGSPPPIPDRGIRRRVRVVGRRPSTVEQATLAEHFYFAHAELSGLLRVNRRRVREEAAQLMKRLEVDFDLSRPAGELRAADRLLVEIVVAASVRPALLILDDTFSGMPMWHKKEVMRIAKALCATGMAALLVTPLADEIMDHVDHITLIRDGESVLSGPSEGLDKLAVLKAAYAQAASGPDRAGERLDIFRRHMSYYISLLTNYPKPFIIVNLRLEIEMMNQAARAFFGIDRPPDADLGRTLAVFFPGAASDLPEGVRANREFSRTGLTFTAGNQRRIVNLFSYRVSEGGSDIGSIILIDDVTEHAHLQEQMLLAEKVASLGILTAGMAHEINHPLSVINNIAEYVKMRFPGPDLAREIGEIQEEVGNINRIIRNLADFSQTGYLEKVDMHAIIRNLVGMVSHFVGEKRIVLELRLCEREFLLQAGRVEMRQVLLNILDNAIHAIEDSGRVVIETRVGGGRGTLTISDNGRGMSRETLNSIFLPFYSRQSGKGMGLGLYIAYNIMENYGGGIRVDSEPGQGTTFILEFELA